jgi:DNA invertase Pin-like site-specific DNA recombinase
VNRVANVFRISAIALTLVSGAARADSALSREQVRADFAAAQAAGALTGAFGTVSNGLSSFPRAQFSESETGKSRAQVRAELSAAQNAGDAPAGFGVTARGLYRDRQDPVTDTGEQKTRQQVRAELAAAQASGEVVTAFGFTARQLFPADYPARVVAPRMADAGTSSAPQ